MSSDGIVHSGNVLGVSFVKLFLSLNQYSCILLVWTCFFIATIWQESPSLDEPLPKPDTALLQSHSRSIAIPESTVCKRRRILGEIDIKPAPQGITKGFFDRLHG